MRYLNNYIPHITQRASEPVTVGLPRALAYYEYGRMWENFFTLLGCSVVLSPATGSRILNLGIKHSEGGACLPVKVMTGHILSLEGMSDVIFLPRHLPADEAGCPKINDLPEKIKSHLKKKTELITFDFGGGENQENALKPVAERLNLSNETVRSALIKAVRNRTAANMEAASLEKASVKPVVSLLGRPYILNDSYLNKNIIAKLRARGYEVATPSSINNAVPQGPGAGPDILSRDFNSSLMPCLKGIISITPSACGAQANAMRETESRTRGWNIPFVKLTVDENTREADFDAQLGDFLIQMEANEAL